MEEHPHPDHDHPEEGNASPSQAPPPKYTFPILAAGRGAALPDFTFPPGTGDQFREWGSSSSDGVALTSSTSRSVRARRASSPYPPKRKLSCPGCDVKFDRQSTLKQHMYSHTGEKPFSCDACGYRFSVASNVRRHMRTCKVIKMHSAKKLRESEGSGVSFEPQARTSRDVAYPIQQDKTVADVEVELPSSIPYDFPSSTPTSPVSPSMSWMNAPPALPREYIPNPTIPNQERDIDRGHDQISQAYGLQASRTQSARGVYPFDANQGVLSYNEDQTADALAMGLRMMRPYGPGPEGRSSLHRQRPDTSESTLPPIAPFGASQVAPSRTDSGPSAIDLRVASMNVIREYGRSRLSVRRSAPQNSETTPGQTGAYTGDHSRA